MQSTLKKKKSSSEQLRDAVVEGMIEKKAKNIVVLDLRNVKAAVADFFVICSGTSDPQLKAIADSIEYVVEEKIGDTVWQKEGQHNRQWMLLDYADVVAHIFLQDRRTFYGIESLWGDAEITEIDS